MLSGYDSASTIKFLDEENIKKIEIFYNNHYEIISNDLKGSAYENRLPFELLPGHRALISSLPGFLNASNSAAKRKNKNNTQRSKPVEVAENTESTSTKLKEELLSKLDAYALKKELKFEFNTESIQNFHFDESSKEFKCSVKCFQCNKITPCSYTTHWYISNLIKHITKQHINSSATELTNSGEDDNLGNSQMVENNEQHFNGERRLQLQKQIENMNIVLSDP